MSKKPAKKAAFASLNPDDMMQGGLPTDFRGTVVAASYTEWDYEGKTKPVLAAKLTIQPHEDEEVNEGKAIIQHWSGGQLKDWAPGDEDGDRVDEGPYVIQVGKRSALNNNTNFAHLMQTILESGTAAKGKPFTTKNLSNSIECLVGLDAHWDRVPQKKRAGMVDRLADDEDAGDEDGDEDEKPQRRAQKNDILVVTEVFGYDPDDLPEVKMGKKKAKDEDAEDADTDEESEDEEEAPKKKPAKKPAKDEDEEAADEEATEDDAEESEEDPFDAELAKAVVKEIKKAKGSLKKSKLSTLMLAAYAQAKPKIKSKAVERATEEEFLSDDARPWTYDEDTGVLTID